MHNIEMQEMSPEFLKCWQAAGIHLDRQAQGGIKTWLRAHPYPPVLEHLSFRLGNQIFFVRVEDHEGKVGGPGSMEGLFSIAEGCQGHACLMPMKKKFFGGDWVADAAGWGLVDAKTRRPINPVELATDETIEMTLWELQDFAVQVVRDQLVRDGYQLMTWQGNPDVDLAIWFVGDSKGPEWVVVRAFRHGVGHGVHGPRPARPANWPAIAASCARMSTIGHYAQVICASPDDPFDPTSENAAPILRGQKLSVRYLGLESNGLRSH